MAVVTAHLNNQSSFNATILTTSASTKSLDKLDDKRTVEYASLDDLAEVLTIYNQSIAGKQATANLTPVTCEERQGWFEEHINSRTRPIYVVRAVLQTVDEDCARDIEIVNDIAGKKIGKRPSQPIVAWGSFSDLYTRPAYHISSEVSIYIHNSCHGQGLGSLLIRWMLAQAPSLGVHNVVALIFAHNQPSLGLFRKLGFEQWGLMPKVCDMDGFIADVVMLGKRLIENDTSG